MIKRLQVQISPPTWCCMFELDTFTSMVLPRKCLDMTKIMLTGVVNFDQTEEHSDSVGREFDLELKGC